MYWAVKEIEENVTGEVKKQIGGVVKTVEGAFGAMESRSRNFIVDQMKELAAVVKKDRQEQDRKLENVVKKVVQAEMAEKKYSKVVRRSVDLMDQEMEAPSTFSARKSEEEYKAEEAQLVARMQKEEANIAAIRGMSRRVRRKARPEAPRPLRLREPEPEVVNLEEEDV